MWFRRLRNFLSLEIDQQHRFAYALFLLTAIRLALWIVPFEWIRRWTRVPCRRRSCEPVADVFADESILLVESAAKLVPGATCLTQSLAARILLARRGVETILHIGVRRGAAGAFEAHAWLERNGHVVGRQIGAGSYAKLAALDG